MKTSLTVSLVVLASLTWARADQEAPVALKNKSAFTMDGSNRDPFWPIGWKPVARANTGDQSGPEIPPSAFLVSSITLDKGGRFAIINGRAMQVGQQFGLQLGTQTYQLTVKAIEDGRVILLRRDEEIIVPLHRK